MKTFYGRKGTLGMLTYYYGQLARERARSRGMVTEEIRRYNKKNFTIDEGRFEDGRWRSYIYGSDSGWVDANAWSGLIAKPSAGVPQDFH